MQDLLAATTSDAAPPRPGAARQPASNYATWLHGVANAPFRFDFYQVLRHVESAHPHLPRLGEATRPGDEPVRVAQPAALTFAPSSVHAVQFHSDGTPLLMQRIFGLLGPNGPLPLHMTELARDRMTHHADPALQRFLDTLTNRFALLFYRAWASAQPALSLDRPGDTSYARRFGALFGIGSESLLSRDAIGDASKLHFTGRLARQTRDADGLLAWCRAEFDVPVHIEQWCGHWMPLAGEERTRLTARDSQGVGRGAVLGRSVWDVQHKFRIVVGPLGLARYLEFLPGGRDIAKLQSMVRQWVGIEFAWDLTLILARDEVPSLHVGRHLPPGMLGRTGWLGRYRRPRDAADLTIDVEHLMQARRAAPAIHAAPAG